jgi:hypothetical protein
MHSTGLALEVEKHIGRLVGLTLLRVGGLFATRQFYFGTAEMEYRFDLQVECPWRIEHGVNLVTGSEDYTEAKDETTLSRDIERASDNLQDRLLLECFGGHMVHGEAVFEDRTLIVNSVIGDPFGGFRLQVGDCVSLAVFPTSSREMEWMLSHVEEGSAILMNGIITVVKRRDCN